MTTDCDLHERLDRAIGEPPPADWSDPRVLGRRALRRRRARAGRPSR